MQTTKERQTEYRKRQSHGGLFKRRDFWVHPDDEQAVRKFIEKLNNKRIKQQIQETKQ